MKLPPVSPIIENQVCIGKASLFELVKTALKNGSGAFLKMFGKSADGIHYVYLLLDDEKILMIEDNKVDTNTKLTGKEALDALISLCNSDTLIVDVYSLSDVDVKISIAENLDVYSKTPKMSISELFGSSAETLKKTLSATDMVGTLEATGVEHVTSVSESSAGETFERPTYEVPMVREETEKVEEGIKRKKPEVEKTKKKKPVIKIEAEPSIEPHMRVLANRIRSDAKSLGIEVEEMVLSARKIIYALGSGSSIDVSVSIKGRNTTNLSLGRIKEILEDRAYTHAGEVSKELGKRVMVNSVALNLT